MKHIESKLFNQNGHFYFSFQICITCTYLTKIFLDILYFDGGCQPLDLAFKKAPYQKSFKFVCYVIIAMENDKSFVLLFHQVPDILHLMTFHD